MTVVKKRQRLLGKRAQGQLMHAFCSRVNRCQVFFHGESVTGRQQAVLGVYHFRRSGSAAHLAVATNRLATFKTGLLCLAEMKKSQCQRTATITDTDQ